jgi:hypothetical protein
MKVSIMKVALWLSAGEHLHLDTLDPCQARGRILSVALGTFMVPGVRINQEYGLSRVLLVWCFVRSAQMRPKVNLVLKERRFQEASSLMSRSLRCVRLTRAHRRRTDGSKTDYVAGPQGNLARIENSVVTYLHPDYLGSAQSGTNSAGTVVWREQYTPFGEELQGPTANDDQAGYTGHIKDKATA